MSGVAVHMRALPRCEDHYRLKSSCQRSSVAVSARPVVPGVAVEPNGAWPAAAARLLRRVRANGDCHERRLARGLRSARRSALSGMAMLNYELNGHVLDIAA